MDTELKAEITRLKALDAARTQGTLIPALGGAGSHQVRTENGEWVANCRKANAEYFANAPKMMSVIARLERLVAEQEVERLE